MSEITRRENDDLRFGESARHASRRRRGPWGALLGGLALGLAVVLVSGSAVAAVVVNFLNQQVQATVVQISETDGPVPEIGALPTSASGPGGPSSGPPSSGSSWVGRVGSVVLLTCR